jgi:hypothetical protein
MAVILPVEPTFGQPKLLEQVRQLLRFRHYRLRCNENRLTVAA